MALEARHPHPHLPSSSASSSSPAAVTVDLLRPPLASAPIGWERSLDLKAGRVFYRRAGMSRRNSGKGPKLDLKLNLSPPPPARGNPSTRAVADDDDDGGSPHRSSSSTSPSSCVSSEAATDSPEATSMVLAGCPRCLMYVMLAEDESKCPRCKSTVLLDFQDATTKKTKKS